MKKLLVLLFLLSLSSLFADVIYLTNGFSMQGEIISVSGDTTIIKTKGPDAKEVKIATDQILRTVKEKPELTMATAMKNVGFGCLGGITGGLIAGTITMLADGFGDGKIAFTVISAATIAGILIGIGLGNK